MATVQKPHIGQIITFYSYKGGTGRTMALANIACLLAASCEKNEKVLMIDWDLEAPGLHHFFNGIFKNAFDNFASLLSGQLGLIDLFYEIKSVLKTRTSDEVSDNFFEELNLEKYICDLNVPSLMLLPAGRLDDGAYSSRVNAFNWRSFFDLNPFVIPHFAEYLRKQYKYVLIDSRTGYTDISGICTSIMPEKLVAMFTLNRQSLMGIFEIIRRATNYRKQSDDLRPLIIYPLPSRIELTEKHLYDIWRFGNYAENIEGYQPLFETILKEIYSLHRCDLTAYFDDIQLQYMPYYSYGEKLSVLSETGAGRLSLSKSFEVFTEKLINEKKPW